MRPAALCEQAAVAAVLLAQLLPASMHLHPCQHPSLSTACLCNYYSACRQGALSEAAATACRQLRGLEPAEAAGVVCWLLDELASGAWMGGGPAPCLWLPTNELHHFKLDAPPQGRHATMCTLPHVRPCSAPRPPGAGVDHLPAAAAFCEEIAAFAAGTAKRCHDRATRQR